MDYLLQYIKTITIATALLSASCAYFVSWNDVMDSWIGHDIEEIVNLWGAPDKIIENDKGQKEYKYHRERVDPSCIHYWVVDESGVIVGGHYEGRCRPIG